MYMETINVEVNIFIQNKWKCLLIVNQLHGYELSI